MKGKQIARLGLLFSVLLLNACAELNVLLPKPDHLRDADVLGPPLQRFTATGRISLSTPERRHHLRFEWDHAPERDKVLLMSPLGNGIAELSSNEHEARLVKGDQKAVVAANITELSEQVFGRALPLGHLAHWMRGATPARSGEIEGWAIEVTELVAFRQHQLVRVLVAKQRDTELKLVVDSWDSPEEIKP